MRSDYLNCLSVFPIVCSDFCLHCVCCNLYVVEVFVCSRPAKYPEKIGFSRIFLQDLGPPTDSFKPRFFLVKNFPVLIFSAPQASRRPTVFETVERPASVIGRLTWPLAEATRYFWGVGYGRPLAMHAAVVFIECVCLCVCLVLSEERGGLVAWRHARLTPRSLAGLATGRSSPALNASSAGEIVGFRVELTWFPVKYNVQFSSYGWIYRKIHSKPRKTFGMRVCLTVTRTQI